MELCDIEFNRFCPRILFLNAFSSTLGIGLDMKVCILGISRQHVVHAKVG